MTSSDPIHHPTANPSFEAAMESGLQASRAGDARVALEAWSAAAGFDPSAAAPHLLIGAELAEAANYTDAEHAFARAVNLAPGFHAARFQLGLLQFTTGRQALAFVTWRPLLDRPCWRHIECTRFFVRAFAALARDALAESVSWFGQGLAATIDNPPLRHDMARVLVEVRRLAEAGIGKASPSAHDEQGSAEAHVLLSAYRHEGRAH